jgi:hypothetical protein
MRLGIMQPYWFPYIGYFQLMNIVDEFVIYDNIQFTRKGWINRNRILVNGKDAFVTLPLRKDSDFLHIRDRYLADAWEDERRSLINRLRETYRKAPYFEEVFATIEESLLLEEPNLFKFLLHSLQVVKDYLSIQTPMTISSGVPVDHALKGEQKVIAICKDRKCETYYNLIGGVNLYNKERFANEGMELIFLKTNDIVNYKQFEWPFVPHLSIIDVMMFNSKEEINKYLNFGYSLEA